MGAVLMALLFSRHGLEKMRLTSDGSGGYTARNQAYTAHINSAGYLASLIVNGVETLASAFTFSAGTTLTADSVTLSGTTVTAQFPVTGGLHTTFTYHFRSNGITLDLLGRENNYGTFTWFPSSSTQGVELLNDKGVFFSGDEITYVTSGETRALPAPLAERNQFLRWHYRGFALETHFEIWGANFNYESAGILNGMSWQRPLINPNANHPFVLDLVPTSFNTTLKAVPFTPNSGKNASLFYTTESLTWTLDLGNQASYQYLLDAGVSFLNYFWQVWDEHDASVATGSGSSGLSLGSTTIPITVQTPGSGYYSVQFTLTDGSRQMRPSSFRTRMTVLHQITGMTNRLDSLTAPFSDYAQMAMIGVGAVRESHDMRFGFAFSNPGAGWVTVPGTSPPVWVNQASYDNIISTAAAQAALYGINWWFQHVSTNFVTPSQLQAIAQYFVNRYRTQIPVIEVENEPNFVYSPQQYVDNALVPYATGAAAGGGIALMGPDGVGIPQTIQYLTTIYSNGKGNLLTNISTHTYPGPGESWEQYNNPELLDSLRALMTANGDSAKTIWQTEQGYTWLQNAKSQAARYTVRQFLQAWSRGILPSHHYYFYPQYNGFESWYLAQGGEAGSRESWLPGGAALRFLAENTRGKTFQSALATPYRGLYLFRFTGGADDVIVAWTWDFSYTLAFDASGLQSVANWMGRAVTPGTSGGHQTLALSGEPLYLHLTTGSAFTVVSPGWSTNFASAASGGTASASSEDTAPALAIDAYGGSYDTRTRWQSTQTSASGRQPMWLAVHLGQSRTIQRFMVICDLAAVDSTPAEWQFQVDVAGTWSTVLFGSAERKWCITGTFAPVTTTKVRFLITRENDGWFYTGTGKRVVGGPSFTQYTSGKMRISDLEVYAT